jgi:hypothetical protein
MEINLEYRCFVSRPISSYDFGVNAYAASYEDETGFTAFEIYDGGYNCASEVIYADILFNKQKRVIYITHFFAVAFNPEKSIVIDYIDTEAFKRIKSTLISIYKDYERVCFFEDEITYNKDFVSKAVSCFYRILPQIALSLIRKFTTPHKPKCSKKLREVEDLFDLVDDSEAKLLQPLYEVIGFDGIDRQENEHDTCSRVRGVINDIIVEGIRNSRSETMFSKFKI